MGLAVGGQGAEEGPEAAGPGPALKPRERSSGPARIAVEEEVAAQSAKAPESDVSCLLVVATTAMILLMTDYILTKITVTILLRTRKTKRERWILLLCVAAVLHPCDFCCCHHYYYYCQLGFSWGKKGHLGLGGRDESESESESESETDYELLASYYQDMYWMTTL